MSSLKKLNTASDTEEDKDVLAGGGFVVDSALLEGTVDMAYLTLPKSGSIGVVVTVKDDANREITDTFWVQSKDEKGNKTYYEKDGVKRSLPGFASMNSLALLTLGKELKDIDDEAKMVDIWDYTARAKVPTKVQVLTELLGKPVTAAILKVNVDKRAKGDDGQYRNTGETRDENRIDKFFRHDDHLTVTEIKANATSPVFYDKWDKRWTGETKMEAEGATASGATAGMPGNPATKSLFPQKK